MLEVHLAVCLFGLAGLFGKTLPLGPIAIVAGRATFAALALAVASRSLRRPGAGPSPRPPPWPRMLALGVLLAVHWVTFFHAIQVSTVAIGLLSFASFPVFVALLEPAILQVPFCRRDVGWALMAMAGVALVPPGYDLASSATRGVLWGLASGLTFALLTIHNRGLVAKHASIDIGRWQNAVAALVLAPFAAPELSHVDWAVAAEVVLLGTVFTGLPHTLFIAGMRGTSASYASLAGTLEPVYGVLAAFVVLGERPTPRTLAGGAIILSTVALATRRRRA